MKKGFTLIELLAVIVILAIIATIAVPIVLSIIEETKESTVRSSAELYIKAVEQKIMSENMKSDDGFEPNVCMVNLDGNVVCDDTTLEIDTSGKKPDSGTMLFSDTVLVDATLNFDNVSLIRNEKDELINSKKIKVCKPVTNDLKTSGNVPKGKFEVGDEYICEVADGVEYNFFVLSVNGDKVNLILDRNINNDGTLATVAVDEANSMDKKYSLVPWISKEDYEIENTDNTVCSNDSCNDEGPISAIKFLNNAISWWSNIPNINTKYEDENINLKTVKKGTNGYGEVRLIGRARLPMYNEVYGENKCLTETETPDGNTCPLWLTNYLEVALFEQESNFYDIYKMAGYWILSSNSAAQNRALTVHHYRYIDDSSVHYLDRRGVRPVITLYKSNFTK